MAGISSTPGTDPTLDDCKCPKGNHLIKGTIEWQPAGDGLMEVYTLRMMHEDKEKVFMQARRRSGYYGNITFDLFNAYYEPKGVLIPRYPESPSWQLNQKDKKSYILTDMRDQKHGKELAAVVYDENKKMTIIMPSAKNHDTSLPLIPYKKEMENDPKFRVLHECEESKRAFKDRREEGSPINFQVFSTDTEGQSKTVLQVGLIKDNNEQKEDSKKRFFMDYGCGEFDLKQGYLLAFGITLTRSFLLRDSMCVIM